MRALSTLLLLAVFVGAGWTRIQTPLESPREEERRAVPSPTDRTEAARRESALRLAEKMARITHLCECPSRVYPPGSAGRPPHPKVEPTGPPPPGRMELEVTALLPLSRNDGWTVTLHRRGEADGEPRRVSLWAFEQVHAGTHFRRELAGLEPGLYDICLEPLGAWRTTHIDDFGSTYVRFDLPWLSRVRAEPVGRAGILLHAPRLGGLAVSRVDGMWWTPAEGDSRLPKRFRSSPSEERLPRSIRAWHTDDGAWEFLCEAREPLSLLPLRYDDYSAEPFRMTPRSGESVVRLSMRGR